METKPIVSSVLTSQGKTILEETFYVLTKKNCIFKVRLTESGLHLIKESDRNLKEQRICMKDIIGCQCLRSKKVSNKCTCQSLPRSDSLQVVEENSQDMDASDISAYLYIYAYIVQGNKPSNKKREHTTITLRFRSFDKYEDNYKEAQRWRTAIKKLIRGEQISSAQVADFSLSKRHKETRKLLILCNPKSGSGKGKQIFQQKVAPMLNEAEIPYDLHMTKHANFARDFVRNSNLFQWSGIIVVGGDGILFEVINGVFERWDWSEIIKAIPMGIIPGGSGNGLARSIAYQFSEPYAPACLPATLAAVKGSVMPMDLVRVETTKQILFSFLSVGWGLISDIDIQSERLRLLGSTRFTIWSIARLIGLRDYGGRLWYLPVDVPFSQPNEKLPITNSIGSSLNLPSEITLETLESRPRVDSWYSANSRKSAYFSAGCDSSYQSTTDSGLGEGDMKKSPDGDRTVYGPASKLPALTAPVPDNWKCITGRFVMVHASYQSHLSEDCLFAPKAKLNDGKIWLLVVRAGATRSQLLQFLLGLSTGAHAHAEGHTSEASNSFVEIIPVNAFRIEPDGNEYGCLSVDGELVDYGPIQAEIFPELGRIMVP